MKRYMNVIAEYLMSKMTEFVSYFEKFDPLTRLPPEVFDKIADYLSDKDVLNCSLVSRSWYAGIAQSKSAMKKLTIYCNDYKRNENLKCLLKSDRPYQNLICHVFDFSLGHEIKFRSILSKFASSIESIETTRDMNQVCDIPKLKSLTFRCMLRSVPFYPDGLMSKTKDVEKLTIKNIARRDTETFNTFNIALRKMEKLKVLDIDPPFEFPPYDACKFLETLTCIKLRHISIPSESEMTPFLTQFPKLRVLHLGNISEDIKHLPSNNTIQELRIYGSWSDPLVLIRSLKCLTNLIVTYLHMDLLKLIIESTTIRTVSYEDLDVYWDDENPEVGENNQMEQMMSDSPIKFSHKPFGL